MSTERPTTLTFYPRWVNGELLPPQAADFNGRTLLVIDPNDREQVERLTEAFYCVRGLGEPALAPSRIANMQAALRSLVADPKPEEPTGLGAVVEDAKGNRWVRAFALRLAWTDTLFSENCREYADIDAVRVLSEGVAS